MQATYRVIETGKIGQLIPCPCDNPIILEFKDGTRDAFFLRELEPMTHPITESYSTRSSNTKNGVKGGSKGSDKSKPGLEWGTIEKMLQIHQFLESQSRDSEGKSLPVYRAAIEKVVGFNCAHSLMHQPSQPKRVTLESLGIVERIPGERTWVAWRLTELGRTEGEGIIRGL